MKFLIRLLSCGLLILSILSGCGGQKEETAPTAYRVVQRIHITYENGEERMERSYETQKEMQLILNYLRWVRPYGTPGEDPMTQPGEEYYVVLNYSDGTSKTYEQRCGRYLRMGDGPWKKIDPERGRELGRLLGFLDGEGVSADPDTGPAQPLLRPKLEWK